MKKRQIFVSLALVGFIAAIATRSAQADTGGGGDDSVDICTLVPFSDPSSSVDDEKTYGCTVAAALDLGKGDRLEQVRKQLRQMSKRSFDRWKKHFSYIVRLYAYRALHHKGYHWRAMFKKKGHEKEYLDDKAVGVKLRSNATDLDVIKASRDAHRALRRSRRSSGSRGAKGRCTKRCPAP